MRYFLLLCLCLNFIQTSTAQGCVAIRGMCNMDGDLKEKTGWELSLSNRYFRSYKHFVNDIEQHERIEKANNVINYSNEMAISIVRKFDYRWSIALIAPFLMYTRTSLYEHDGLTRNKTSSFGIGDVRISAYRWMIDPEKHPKGNIQLGLGIKLPTGNANYQDYFYRGKDSFVMGAVDQSIQLGDGGTGVSFEMNSFIKIKEKFSAYCNGFYLLSPREVNGTSTTRGGVANATARKYNTDVMSVPDLYMARIGMGYQHKKWTFMAGLRIEGLPSSDLVGGSRGFRRPGLIVSAEPTFVYTEEKYVLNFSLPISLYRNRTKSNSDIRRSADTNTDITGDAAFADYLMSIGVKFKL